MVQRQVLYLGETNDNQQKTWRKSIEVFNNGDKETSSMGSVLAISVL